MPTQRNMSEVCVFFIFFSQYLKGLSFVEWQSNFQSIIVSLGQPPHGKHSGLVAQGIFFQDKVSGWTPDLVLLDVAFIFF